MARCELFYFKEENFFKAGPWNLTFWNNWPGWGWGGGGERWLGGSGTSGEEKFSRSLMKGKKRTRNIWVFLIFLWNVFFFGVALTVANCFSDPGCFFCSETFKLWNTREYFVLTSTGGNWGSLSSNYQRRANLFEIHLNLNLTQRDDDPSVMGRLPIWQEERFD